MSGRATRLLVIAVAVLLGLAFEVRFARLKADQLDLPPGTHVWAHRGTHGGFQGEGKPLNRIGENTLQAFEASIATGFTGIELDIYYLGQRGFVVKHDPPTPADHLRLDEVFERCGRKVYYWLDFKNLSDSNVDDVIVAFRKLFERYPVRDRIVIESAEAAALAKLRNADGVKVLYWIKKYPEGFRNLVARTRVRWKLAWFGFHNVSASFYVCKETFLGDLGLLGIYVYTVNDVPRMAALRDAGVRVILTDRDTLPPGIKP